MGGIDLKKATRETVRWYILKVLDAARPMGTTETIILTTLAGIPLDITQAELRRELDYLEERNLVTITGKGTPVWFADLKRYGIDIVEYTVDCHPGITRPPKFWEG